MQVLSEQYHYDDKLERYAASAWRRFNLKPPVTLSDIVSICKFLHIRIHEKAMAPDVFGLYVVTPKLRRVIRVNKSLDLRPTSKRFTIAHEIGHHLMLPSNPRPGTVCELRKTMPINDEELRANRFAGALLMPHWLVQELWEEYSSNPYGRIAIIADRFGVARATAQIRVRDMGLEIATNRGQKHGK